MRIRKISITSVLALILACAMLIGIISNIFVPLNLKATCLVLIGCLAIWYLKPLYLKWTGRLSQRTFNWILAVIIILMMVIQLLVLRFLPASCLS